MLTVPALPALDVPGPWQTTVESWTRFTGSLRMRGPSGEVVVAVERCAAGRLRDAYPVGARDVELLIHTGLRAETLPNILRPLVRAVRAADPGCRRVVYAVTEGDRAGVEAAEATGFRYAVDVDLQDKQLSLLVAEPDWVTVTDMDLDHVPGT
ncbi:hypothetical protein [Streptomyces sp. NPDC012510]|uniref:hypothetical protein n=1 Tax=Streptomyces sp. NPDC012510 TaxID=3364838 RepID=UPI0036EF3515